MNDFLPLQYTVLERMEIWLNNLMMSCIGFLAAFGIKVLSLPLIIVCDCLEELLWSNIEENATLDSAAM